MSNFDSNDDLTMELEAKKLCNDYINELDTNNTRIEFNINKLLPIITKIINNKYAMVYLSNPYNELDQTKCKTLIYLYKKIIINNQTNFIQLTKLEDLCLSIIFTLFH
jgi:hypothetical protein